jgi:hypothetical protein
MTPVSARNRHGRVYRYYVSAPLQVGGRRGDDGMVRVAAPLVEKLVLERLSLAKIATTWCEARGQLISVEVDATEITIGVRPSGKAKVERLDPADRVHALEDGQLEIRTHAKLRAWGGRSHIVRVDGHRVVGEPRVDASLVRGLARAHALVRLAKASSEPTVVLDGVERDVTDSYVRRMSRLAFLAPDIQKAIVEGRQPPSLTLERLMRTDVPIHWAEQRQLLGF